MGQTSSQLESTQLQSSADTDQSSYETYFSPKASPAQKPAQKRARSLAQDDAMPPPKKKRVKTTEEHDAREKRKARRSIPQHCRGTAILPSQEETVPESSGEGGDGSQEQAVEGSSRQTPPVQNAEQTPLSGDIAPVTKAHVTEDAQQPHERHAPVPKRKKERQDQGDHAVEGRETAENVKVEASLAERPRARKKKKTKGKEKINDELEHTEGGEREESELLLASLDVPMTSKDAAGVTAGRRRDSIEEGTQQQQDHEVEIPSRPKQRQRSDPGDDAPLKTATVGEAEPQRKKSKTKNNDESATKSNAIRMRLEPGSQKRKRVAPAVHDTAPEPSGAAQKASIPASTPADLIPTPPTSQNVVVEPAANAGARESGRDEHYDPGSREGYVEASNQISGWLDSQESPLPPDQISPLLGSAKRATKPKGEKTANSVDEDDASDEYRDGESASDPDESIDAPIDEPKLKAKKKTKRKESAQPTRQNPSASKDSDHRRGAVKGAWTKDEKALADSIFASACAEANLTAHDMKCQIIEWSAVGSLKDEMFDAFPSRTRVAIRKFCQRRFQPYNTGPWTKEEDENLKQQVAAFGKSWVNVGSYVDRAPEACRDRWKNVVQHQGTMETGPWSLQEENKLAEAVEELLVFLKRECQDVSIRNDPERLETLIDWNNVAKALEGRRSAKRCLEKWKILKRRAHNVGEDSRTQISASQTQQAGSTKLQKALDAAYGSLGWADVYDALMEICSATAKEPDREYEHESTLWSVVGAANAGSKFDPKLRRRCYLEMLEEFGSSDRLKEAAGIGGKAGVLVRHLRKLKKSGTVEWERKLEGKKAKEKSVEKNVGEDSILKSAGRKTTDSANTTAPAKTTSSEKTPTPVETTGPAKTTNPAKMTDPVKTTGPAKTRDAKRVHKKRSRASKSATAGGDVDAQGHKFKSAATVEHSDEE